ncbi:MAG: Hpt domain-containing protein [Burkholderiaceae bacterium]|jgi:histidine phosphotransfer protein HptB|nr:Hpt domain-containing protein [Burkholderiaceae bacterium]MCU0966496.1 Hpt domain-containing protein [Burkholderiaceae bacterium]
MADTVIDAATFAELQDAAGAEFVGELIVTFLEEAPQMLAELRAAQAAAAAEAFRRAAHSIKSNAHTFGALRLSEMARELELGGVAADAAPVDALQAEYERVAAALQDLSRG